MHPEHTHAFRDTVLSAESLPASPFPTAQYGISNIPTTLPSPSVPTKGVCAGAGDEGSGGEGNDSGINDNDDNLGVKTPRKGKGDSLFPLELKNLISQYEAMGSSQAPAFHVKTNWQGRQDSPISRFPNEILIHSLSFLDPHSLLAANLVSRRFHSLIASPHAWLSAFSRYFPSTLLNQSLPNLRESTAFSSFRDRRHFTRLSSSRNGGNPWRREYILRTRLLRSLAKGKGHAPTYLSSSTGKNSQESVVITYHALVDAPSVSHMSANFSPQGVRLLHSSVDSGVVTASDATIGKVERVSVSAVMHEIATRPDLVQPILGLPGFEVATDMGAVGVMDLSEDVGWVYGENVVNGKCYVHPYSSPYRSALETGFFIRHDWSAPEGLHPVITAVWIAKKRSGGVLETTEGQVGVITGSSRGFVGIYGLNFGKEHGLTPTKRFCVCPGVPIVSIKVDEDYSVKRKKQNTIWVVIVNALGEVHYLANPKEGWKIIPQTIRRATFAHNSCFPPSANSMAEDEAKRKKREEDEALLNMEYPQLKRLWEGWGMNWFIELDWAGRNVVVGKKGSVERQPSRGEHEVRAGLVRYHLVSHVLEAGGGGFVREVITPSPGDRGTGVMSVSVFDGTSQIITQMAEEEAEQREDSVQWARKGQLLDEWVAIKLEFGERDICTITAIAIDNSNLALLLPSEDPGLTPDVPGGNARLFAVGTNMGSVFVWNIRHPILVPTNDGDRSPNRVAPQRVIRTESPQISALALSSLYLAHGGTDGLVQAWDLLASTISPVRTIHSKLSARQRRMLTQADSTPREGFGDVGSSRFAPRCLVLDPDPARLRGAVALGNCVRSWCFSSSSSGPNPSKRSKEPRVGSRIRSTPSRGRGEVKEAIRSDSKNLVTERDWERREREELEKRYGLSSGQAALSEDEMLEYARMVSMETYELEVKSGGSTTGKAGSRTITPEGSSRATSSHGATDEFADVPEEVEDLELAEALRLSLKGDTHDGSDVNSDMGDFEIWEDAPEYPRDGTSPTPTIAGPSRRRSPTPYAATSNRSPAFSPLAASGWGEASEWPSVGSTTDKGKGKVRRPVPRTDEEELELAIQLSLREEEARRGFMRALGEHDWAYMPGTGKERAS